jgi:glycosyltransferase involved in cell wall biosynthesis
LGAAIIGEETMKVLMIPSWYFSDERPTLGSFFREQALAILDEGVDIRVAYTELRNPNFILSDFKNKKKMGLNTTLDSGLKTHRDIQYNIPPRITLCMEVRFYRGLKRILNNLIVKENWKPDIIHIHSFFPAGYGVLKLHAKYNIPYIITEHSTGFSNQGYKKYQLNYLREILERSSKIIAVGKGLKTDLKNYTNKSIEIIPNMVDCDRFKNEKILTPEKFTFFSLAYLTHKKGFDLLITAFAQAFAGNVNVVLKIGGDGAEKEKLKKLCIELKVDTQVLFLGGLTRKQVVDEMNACHSFVLASRFETFGVVFIEALSCGKPIIVPSIEGPQEIVNETNGLVFERENIDDLKNKLIKIKNNYDRYIPSKIRTDCYALYDVKTVSKKIIKLYEETK